MKKLFVLAAVTALCAGTASGQSKEETEAYRLIECTNTVIDLSNEFNHKYGNFRTFIDGAGKAYERYSEKYTPGENVNAGNHQMLHLRYNFYNKYDEALAAVPDGVDGKAEVSAAMSAARGSVDAFIETAKKTTQYFESAGFVEDDFAQYHTLKAELDKGYETIENSWKAAAGTASEYGKKAEQVLMGSNPDAVYIRAMQDDMELFNQLVTDLYDMEDGDFDYDALIERNTAMKETLEQHKALADGVSTSDVKSIGRFRSFYTHLLSAQKALTYILTELDKESPNYGGVDAQANSLNTYFNAAINSYNEF